MSPGDIRAIENPISAMFDLADKVSSEAPRVKQLVRYASVFIAFWLVLNFILILVTLRWEFIVSIFLMIMFVIGIFTLLSLRNLNDFFKYYAMRHNFIRSVRDADPVALVPQGSTAVERLRSYLSSKNPEMSPGLMVAPTPQVLKGASGMFYQFDLYVTSKPGALWRLLGLGYPGYQMFIKYLDNAPRQEDISSMKRAVEDVANDNHLPASRILILWSRKGTDLSEESYNAINSSTVVTQHRGKSFSCALELIVEDQDGTYEFIPYLAGTHSFPTVRVH